MQINLKTLSIQTDKLALLSPLLQIVSNDLYTVFVNVNVNQESNPKLPPDSYGDFGGSALKTTAGPKPSYYKLAPSPEHIQEC